MEKLGWNNLFSTKSNCPVLKDCWNKSTQQEPGCLLLQESTAGSWCLLLKKHQQMHALDFLYLEMMPEIMELSVLTSYFATKSPTRQKNPLTWKCRWPTSIVVGGAVKKTNRTLQRRLKAVEKKHLNLPNWRSMLPPTQHHSYARGLRVVHNTLLRWQRHPLFKKSCILLITSAPSHTVEQNFAYYVTWM